MSEAEQDAGKVLALPKAPTRVPNPIELAPPEYPRCDHERVTVYENKREVRCNACGAHLDPLDFMVAWSQRARRHDERIDRAIAAEAVLKVHAVGTDRWTLCGLSTPKRGWVVTVTNMRHRVTCPACSKKLQGLPWDQRLPTEALAEP